MRKVEAHHYCTHVNEEVRQCIIFDNDDKNARLIGIEYIISRRLFEQLPEEEKKYWHSHQYEASLWAISVRDLFTYLKCTFAHADFHTPSPFCQGLQLGFKGQLPGDLHLHSPLIWNFRVLFGLGLLQYKACRPV